MSRVRGCLCLYVSCDVTEREREREREREIRGLCSMNVHLRPSLSPRALLPLSHTRCCCFASVIIVYRNPANMNFCSKCFREYKTSVSHRGTCCVCVCVCVEHRMRAREREREREREVPDGGVHCCFSFFHHPRPPPSLHVTHCAFPPICPSPLCSTRKSLRKRRQRTHQRVVSVYICVCPRCGGVGMEGWCGSGCENVCVCVCECV
jgi:hypothetical protein